MKNGKISRVYIETLDVETCSPVDAGKYYFYSNTVDVSEKFASEYEEYELKQSRVRNSSIADAIKRGDINGNVDMGTALIAISAISERAIVMVETN